uniref:UNC93-like protein n=1 Tax=Biomphalaria glabrata TaxID=6526 RepID=A0A2C9JVH4_BIOGL
MTVKVILKNVFVVSLAFTFLFTAFNSMANLQTSLNKEDGVGAWSMSTIYVSLIVSCMFLPNFIISRLGCKWTIPISMIGYILFMGANFYAVKGTMIPASIILGMGAAPLWSAKCTYLTQIGVWYSKLTNQDQDGVINTFFGFFFLFFQTSQIWGNLISSLVFTPDQNKTDSGQCGAAFCPSDAKGNGSDNFSQTSDKVYTVCGIYIASAVIAVIIASLFLDQITLDKETKAEDRKLSPQLLVSTFRHLFSSPIQVMLIPLTIYSGVEQAFIGGDFTKVYPPYTFCLFISLFVFLFHPKFEYFFPLYLPMYFRKFEYFFPCISALYGHLFSDKAEAAFANYRLWESLGFAVTFAYNDYLCTDTKLYVCLGVLGTAVICYTIVEVMAWRKKKYSADITN